MLSTRRCKLPAPSCKRAQATSSCSSKATKAVCSTKPNTSSRKIFPPQLLEVEQGHGRIEWRGIKGMTVTPAEMGFPHVLQLARLDRIRVLKGGQQEAETVWLITSLSPDQANASRLLKLARQYWSIEPCDIACPEK